LNIFKTVTTFFLDGNNENIVEFTPSYSVDYCKVSKDTYAIQLNNHTYMLKFKTHIGKVFKNDFINIKRNFMKLNNYLHKYFKIRFI